MKCNPTKCGLITAVIVSMMTLLWQILSCQQVFIPQKPDTVKIFKYSLSFSLFGIFVIFVVAFVAAWFVANIYNRITGAK